MRKIKLTIMYDGTRYVGWQLQPNGLSVQSLLQDAVSKMIGRGAVVAGASRTDAGVHALGQVAHFETERDIPLDGFVAGINAALPGDVAVVAAEEAPEDFHARKSAMGKRYVYRVLVSPRRNPFLEGLSWRLKSSPDLDLMRQACECLVGERDFASFRAAGCSSRNAVRTITKIDISARPLSPAMLAGEGEVVEMVFEGNGFVRHMIRNIVGTLVDVGLGKIRADEVIRILEAKERIEAGRCAPASGLFLAKVFY